MRVCIAEKPSVAREIAMIVGAKSKRDGYYEGNGFQVTWTFGHLCTLKEPHDYLPEWKRWDLYYLPMIPSRFGIKLINNTGVEKQFNTIKKLVENCDELINCGDAGQEGELIQRWVLSKAACKAPMKRLWISSLTEEAIREGFKNLKDSSLFDPLYEAGASRAIGDWLLGMNMTRLYTLKYGGNKQVLSIGRVQTPTLALIVSRQHEIDHFKPEPYWELQTKYRDCVFNSTHGRYAKKEEAEQLLERIKEHDFTVTKVEQKNGVEQSPRLFDLTSLQVECNRKFSFSADDTLKLIQSLYEKKLCSYPRVDTTFLSDDIYPKIPKIMDGLVDYKSLTALVLEKKIPKSKQVFNNNKVTDHHAIIPTGVPAQYLDGREQQVYDLIARRFIAAFYPVCKISTTNVLGEIAKVKFKASGRQILDPGWRVVINSTKAAGSEQQLLPDFKEGEHGEHDPALLEKMTRPPKFYSEATLLRAMETAGKQVDDDKLRDAMKENGIGRPSTRANIIETLFKRKYLMKEKKTIKATALGIELIGLIEEELLKSVELTGMWERKLRKIESGEQDAKTFMDELKQMVSDIVFNVRHGVKPEKVKQQQECPFCGQGHLIKGKKAWGCSRWKEGCEYRKPFENS